MTWTQLQERFENSATGRAAISCLVVAVALIVTAFNLPNSHIKSLLTKGLNPTANTVGLDQQWGMFAPDPRSVSIDFVAQIQYADGTQQLWRPPAQGTVLTPYSTYQWWKWVENIEQDDNAPYWYSTAVWVARQHAARHPTTITLIRKWRVTNPPNVHTRQSWHSYDFYTLQVDPGILR